MRVTDECKYKSLILYFLYCMDVFLITPSNCAYLKSVHCCAKSDVHLTVTKVHVLPECSVLHCKALSSCFSTSHFLMPILQENFPFVQKSSRTLVRYNRMLHHITQECQTGGCDYWTTSHLRRNSWVLVLNSSFWSASLTQWSFVDWLCCSLQECYVHNLLRVTIYIPSIRRDILEVIIGKMLKLDVSGWTPNNSTEMDAVSLEAPQSVTLCVVYFRWVHPGQKSRRQRRTQLRTSRLRSRLRRDSLTW